MVRPRPCRCRPRSTGWSVQHRRSPAQRGAEMGEQGFTAVFEHAPRLLVAVGGYAGLGLCGVGSEYGSVAAAQLRAQVVQGSRSAAGEVVQPGGGAPDLAREEKHCFPRCRTALAPGTPSTKSAVSPLRHAARPSVTAGTTSPDPGTPGDRSSGFVRPSQQRSPTGASDRDAAWGAAMPGGRRTPPTGPVRPAFDLGCYLIQASTLARLASTHFLAAASGVILSTAMYFATAFWSSFVQLKFFTRS